MRVLADEEKCCAAGQCAVLVPEVFDQDEDDGMVVVLDPRPQERLHHAVLQAVAACPGSALRVDR
ncbi:ferredoxin [Streptomyces nitrosporeus]|uniref:Ferredoxin n=1 Tax=Streptomyces nitrosporeus TaxID=28894 RepID=A0A5J6FPR6_9ACTN|nr:ferredoxin [Streptomyces nitrosporeus]QEU76860.1 ferredoxin [Streptomyces nitrosporeus]